MLKSKMITVEIILIPFNFREETEINYGRKDLSQRTATLLG